MANLEGSVIKHEGMPSIANTSQTGATSNSNYQQEERPINSSGHYDLKNFGISS